MTQRIIIDFCWTADHSFRELTSMICCRMLSTSLVSRLMPARSSWGRRAVRSTTTLLRMSCRFSCTDLSVQQICHYSKKPKQIRFHFLFEENLFWENWAFVPCMNRCKRLQVRCLRGVPLSKPVKLKWNKSQSWLILDPFIYTYLVQMKVNIN